MGAKLTLPNVNIFTIADLGMNVRYGWKTDVAEGMSLRHPVGMTSYNWKHPERRDLYLAARILAHNEEDGDWRQWASDTLIQDLELHDDPRQGVTSWLASDEEQLASELAERLWRLVEAGPFKAADLLVGLTGCGSKQARETYGGKRTGGGLNVCNGAKADIGHLA